jgi:signal peptidase I
MTPPRSSSSRPASNPGARKTPLKSLGELVATVAVAVGLALLIQAFVVKPYRIPSPSMVPTLAVGQRILALRLSGNPGVGDIVVFHPPAGANNELTQAQCGSSDQGIGHPSACDTPTPQESTQTFIKRVVGVPGDRLSIVGGHVYRNGKLERAPYAQPCTGASFCTFRTTFVVPPGDYFMMGDNRGVSDDSRFWGPVPGNWIIGNAIFTYWPISRIGTL